jgi:hypothetical protein
MFTFLEDTNSQRLFDELFILNKLWVLLKSRGESCATVFGYLERRLFVFDQVKQSLDFWAALNNMGAF